MKLFITFCAVVFALQIHGQEKSMELDSGSYIFVKNLRLNLFVEPSVEIAAIKGSPLNFASFGGGVLINDRFYVSGFFQQLADEYQFIIIFPNTFKMNMVLGGVQMGYAIPINPRLSVVGQQKLGFGEMIATYRSNTEAFSGNNFMMYQPSVALEVNVARFAKLHAAIGYRFIDKVDIQRHTPDDFKGITYQLAVRLGLFKRMKLKTSND